MTLSPLTLTRGILVCCGPGGVGKTTSAAVLALDGARQGRRAVVVTIDPAKRLADALGLETLPNAPHRIEGEWPGELWALMLDTKGTFDSLVVKYAATPEHIARAALDLLADENRRLRIKARLAEIVSSLGGPGATLRAAEAIVRLG